MAMDYGNLGIGALFGGLVVLGIFVMIGLYVYMALVYMTLAKKLGQKDIAWLAWIPIANLALIPILAEKHWTWAFMFLLPIANLVFYFIWTWKIYERRKYPGALCLIPLAGFIPYLGWLAGIANLVVLGLVAWSDKK
ncbi:hypothetical protein JXA12_01750 [Candidatus Woesearchaeota archaeon]|nr:hypothetical protein [Candidatus Woesearchaeota archaeon]